MSAETFELRLDQYKHETMAACTEMRNEQKLEVLEPGDEEQLKAQIASIFKRRLPASPHRKCHIPISPKLHIRKQSPKTPDIGRLPGLSSVRLIEGTVDQFARAASEDSVALVVFTHFPRTMAQLQSFNQHIGGLQSMLFIDCVEQQLNDDMDQYKSETLPLVRHLDELGKLDIVSFT
ncbi:hypothetical protein Ciccas_013297 [Cichlidogyrus casuarinus]|uniref:Uncharacterized protein n=1 Tax=Cichlidogyrus casuarinus TaxID=1844966 RepID=A0ABD2PKZ0_9PLAT